MTDTDIDAIYRDSLEWDDDYLNRLHNEIVKSLENGITSEEIDLRLKNEQPVTAPSNDKENKLELINYNKTRLKIRIIISVAIKTFYMIFLLYTIYSIIYSFDLYKKVKEDDNCSDKSKVPHYLYVIPILKSICLGLFALGMCCFKTDFGIVTLFLGVGLALGISMLANIFALDRSFRAESKNCDYEALIFLRSDAIVDIICFWLFVICFIKQEDISLERDVLSELLGDNDKNPTTQV